VRRESGPASLVPPDAGASYMGFYGLGNPWTIWLLNAASELVAEVPSELVKHEPSRSCPGCQHPMVRRPGAWRCYRHDEPITVLAPVRLEKAPMGKVLTRVGEMLDFQRDEWGNWKVRNFQPGLSKGTHDDG